MVFTSVAFLALFFPLFFTCYFLSPRRLRNAVVLVASLGFYWIGAHGFAWWLIALIVANYVAGEAIHRSHGVARKLWLGSAVAAGVALLVVYKYSGFAVGSWNSLMAALGKPGLPLPKVLLPLGISFFTFQGIAYLIDVYREKHAPARSLLDFAVFKTCFPQLVAGPIVRFDQVAEALEHRRETLDQFFDGFVRFSWGLFRKLVFADTLAVIADAAFKTPDLERSVSLAWLGVVCYSLQIYHDFAGYSDMAIGMGRMMGFEFPENFDQPYRSKSVTEFWRRWHQSLSTWFRDYLYIPLGGSRCGAARTYFNLGLVFVLCGLWHGAAWTFVAWGAYHGILLVAERVVPKALAPRGYVGWGFTLITVGVGWVFFRAESMPAAIHYLQSLFHAPARQSYLTPWFYLSPDRLLILFVAAATALLPLESVKAKFAAQPWTLARGAAAAAGYCYSMVVLAANGFNPFIYFRF